MKKDPIKSITIDKNKEQTELCVQVELYAQQSATQTQPEIRRKKVRIGDIRAHLKSIGQEHGVCLSGPGMIHNSDGPITGCWQFELPTEPKSLPSKSKTTTNRKKTKTA